MNQDTTSSTGNAEEVSPSVDMFTMVVLRRRIEAILGDMVNALFKSGRSGVLNTAKDFTCSLTDAKLRTLSTAVGGLPLHAAAIELIPRAVRTKFGDNVHPGDCFVNNSGYHGNTHCGDFTLCVPIFFNGKLVFYSIARAHLADIGFPTPTTYGPLSRDVYEEGLMFPCIRIQRERRDVEEVIDICRANIRAPDLFYGDYLACLAAVRTGESAIEELCAKYGIDTIEAFLEQYQTYAETMATAAIRKLPAGRIEKEAYHDSTIPGAPGIPVRAILTVDPEAAMVEVDLRHNIDNLPLGINLTESTTTASCRNAVLNSLGPDVPRCTGAYRRVRVLLREGSAVGIPRHPAATSAATTNLNQVLAPLVQSMFAELSPGLGSAFSTVGNPGSCSVLSGRDFRHGRAFANQIIMGFWGGGAVHGHDGWLTLGGSGAAGVLSQASVEVVEQQQPILVERLEIGVDSGGPGQWEGAPGAHCVYRTRQDEVRFTTNAGGRDYPPAGAVGGKPGGRDGIWRLDAEGANKTALPSFLDVTLSKGERLVSQACGGGGYGDPLDRNPARVAHTLLEGWISPQRAHDDYGVVARLTEETCEVDEEATAKRREDLRAARTSAKPAGDA